MKNTIKQICAIFLVMCMLVSVFPVTSNAASDFTNSKLNVVTNKESTLATGVTLDNYTVYDKNGDQVRMYVTTADMNVDTVELFASYKNMDPTNYGMSKLTEQVASFNEKAAAGDEYYKGTVVAGINASYYNMTTGKPTGTFVMNGIDVTDEKEGNNYGYFAVMKDGSVKIGKPGDYSNDKGNIQEAIGIYKMLITDGEINKNLNTTTKYPRQTIGITADNKVIIMMADGNQAPKSIGLTEMEQAEVMLDLGCVWAGHLDGGGSGTYACKPEGSDEFVITNSPSDGSERSVSNGFIVVSTEAQSKEFNKLMFSVDNEYLTPGTSVAVKETGVSSSGNAADIPADITFETTNCSYEDGVLKAGTETGDAVLTAIYNGKEVGKLTLNVVNPDKLTFDSSIITVPYNKTVELNMTATYGINEILMKPEDFTIELSDNAIGTLDGFSFTSCEEDETITGGIITATLNANPELQCEATIVLGKGSEVLQDFEKGVLPEGYNIKTGYPQYGPKGSAKDENGNYYYNGQNEIGHLEVVTAENGKVHDGEYALAVECDFTQPYETGYHLLNLTGLNFEVPANAQKIGMWIYIPELEELLTSSMRFSGKTATGVVAASPWLWDNCEPYGWDNDGWKYLSMDISGFNESIKFDTIQIYICDRDNSAVDFTFIEHASVTTRFTYYIDNIMVDYSSAVDDREAPVFGKIIYADTTMADAAELNGNVVVNNDLSFSVKVQDDTTKSNYTGLDEETAKAYIDGVEVKAKYANGMISLQNAVLADGTHTIRFEMCDKMGNLAYAENQITVNAKSNIPTVSIVPQNPNADLIPIGSLYWVNLVSNDIQNVDTATVEFNLNSVSNWELDHMVTTPGFKADYTYDYVTNNATITVEKVGKVLGDSDVLVQVPIRTWESRLTEYEGYEDQTPEKLWSRKIIWPYDIKLSADYGLVKFEDGTETSFSMAPVEVITELYGNYGEMNEKGNYSDRTRWHKHTPEAMQNTEATCMAAGYEGRTFCKECNSVVEWGTTEKILEHKLGFVDGILQCTNGCNEKYTGTYEGKEYVDGVLVADGWSGNSYYVNGEKLTGVQRVVAPDSEEEYYYEFSEDGVCKGKYTGLIYDEEAGVYRYSQVGSLSSGWKEINGEWYYFHSSLKAAKGVYDKNYFFSIYDVVYEFEETGKLKSGVWLPCYEEDSYVGTMYFYGPTYYKSSWREIDGSRYYFDGVYRLEGLSVIMESNAKVYKCFEFDENGKYIGEKDYTGFINQRGNNFYVKNGIATTEGLFVVDGDYYYARGNGFLATGEYHVTRTNGLMPEGTYEFDSTGKMILREGIVEEDGLLYYYVNGVRQPRGMYYNEEEGYYVYAKTNGSLATGRYYVNATNDLLPKDYYDFGEDGKLFLNTGIVEEDGLLYYYVNGVRQPRGMYYNEEEGYYVYAKTNGSLATGRYYVNATNDLLPKDYYNFGEDGKLFLNTGIVEEDGLLYYYVNGVRQPRGLYYNEEGYYVYVKSNGSLATGVYYVNATNDLLPKDYYDFGEDGKYCPVTGVVEENGLLYYYVDGVKQPRGMYYNETDDYYVYAKTNGSLATGRYYVNKTNGLLPNDYYDFGEDGKLYLNE